MIMTSTRPIYRRAVRRARKEYKGNPMALASAINAIRADYLRVLADPKEKAAVFERMRNR